MSTSASTDDAAVAIYICTEGIAEPDQLVLDATKAARAGTRSPAEVVEAFRQAQDMVEALSDQAEADGLWFSETLQDYADVIGRLRVSGDGDLEDLLEAREKINTSCLIPTPSS